MWLDWLDYLRARKGGPSVPFLLTFWFIGLAILKSATRNDRQRTIVACLLGFVILVGLIVTVLLLATRRRDFHFAKEILLVLIVTVLLFVKQRRKLH
jgi:uncharacterized membrane protein YhaH (DUF805 family)